MDYMKEFERKKKRATIGNAILYVLVIVVLTLLILLFVCQKTSVLGDSMLPLMNNGDEIIIDKVTYSIREPERFDVIVFKFRYLADTLYIKRIIGLPGETVQIKDGKIYINDVLLNENYGLEDYIDDPGLAQDPIILGPDEYFVLGDNRNVSKDSRDKTVAKVKHDEIVGRALFRIRPVDRIGFIKHE